VYNNSPSFGWTPNFCRQAYEAMKVEGKDVLAYERGRLMSVDTIRPHWRSCHSNSPLAARDRVFWLESAFATALSENRPARARLPRENPGHPRCCMQRGATISCAYK
jgi:hypothetical protein